METSSSSLPSPDDVAVVDVALRGRGLVACRDLPAGHVVLVDLPALLVPAPDASHGVCAACLKRLDPSKGEQPLPCPGCWSNAAKRLPVLFCSRECLDARAGRPSFHTPAVCRALQSVAFFGGDGSGGSSESDLPDADAACSLRFVVTLAALRAEAAAGAETAALFGALSPMAAPETAVARLGARELALRAGAAVASAGGGGAVQPLTPTEVGAWLAVEEANGFAALGSSSSSSPSSSVPRVRGTCFYPRAYFFNHDCLPNVARFDDLDAEGGYNGGTAAALEAAMAASAASPASSRRTALVAVTLHAVPRGEELCLSYTPLRWGRAERAGRLAACYGFACRCARCLGELEAFGGGDGSPPSFSPLDEEMAAAIGAAASWARAPGFATEAQVEEVLGAAMRLATEAAAAGASASAPSPTTTTSAAPAEIGYIRTFLAKYSCPATRKGSGGAGEGEEEEEQEEEEECGGTLAPVGPSRYQCNSCGFSRSEEEFLQSLAALDDDDDDDEDDDDEDEDEEMEG